MSDANLVRIQNFLTDVAYPTNKSALLQNAKNLGADDNVRAFLERLPDKDFQTPGDVSHALGHSDSGCSPDGPGAATNAFVSQAVQDSLAEIVLCELALQKTDNADIRQFAQRMIDAQGQIGQEAESLAEQRNVELPTDLMPEQKSLIDHLSKLSGPAFDREFMDCNVKEHEKHIAIFNSYAEQESDGDLRALEQKCVHILSQHLSMAREIGRRLRFQT